MDSYRSNLSPYDNPEGCLNVAEILTSLLQECESDEERDYILLLADRPKDRELAEILGRKAGAIQRERSRFRDKIERLLVEWEYTTTTGQKTFSVPAGDRLQERRGKPKLKSGPIPRSERRKTRC